ncbi:MAG TPA: ribonuclease H [Dehalococcoidia bacterium]|nr:ribonuclease H [Dehalococcoidia bacterium]
MTETQPAVVYTDGSAIGNPGPGGWGVHIEYADGRVAEMGGGATPVTNNQMELRAAIEALRATADEPAVEIHTDSTYVRKGITEWIGRWKAGGWRTRADQDVKNLDLWRELDELNRPQVKWEYVRAHVGIPGNERADAIALWFAQSVAKLGTERITPSRPRSTPTRRNTTYLSLVDGVLERHRTWAETESRVRGKRGARYKKTNGRDHELETVLAWGLAPEDLATLDLLDERRA